MITVASCVLCIGVPLVGACGLASVLSSHTPLAAKVAPPPIPKHLAEAGEDGSVQDAGAPAAPWIRPPSSLARASNQGRERAAPFVIEGPDRPAAVQCLATAVYYEAALEPRAGQEAVAQVVINRVRHAGYPKTVCGVVFQGADGTGCQFSFACDGSTRRPPVPRLWRAAEDVAESAVSGHVQADVEMATHYHADWMRAPWASSLVRVGQIGRHVFFRPSGAAGEADAFRRAYAGGEQPGSGTDAMHTRRSALGRAMDGFRISLLDLASPDGRRPTSPGGRQGGRISDLPGARVLFMRR